MFGFINRVDKVIWPPCRDSNANVSNVRPSSEEIDRSQDGLMLETSVLESLYGSQIALSIPSIKQNVNLR